VRGKAVPIGAALPHLTGVTGTTAVMEPSDISTECDGHYGVTAVDKSPDSSHFKHNTPHWLHTSRFHTWHQDINP
jgi:hypothetical protein